MAHDTQEAVIDVVIPVDQILIREKIAGIAGIDGSTIPPPNFWAYVKTDVAKHSPPKGYHGSPLLKIPLGTALGPCSCRIDSAQVDNGRS